MKKYHKKLILLIFLLAPISHTKATQLDCHIQGPPRASHSPDELKHLAGRCTNLEEAALLANRAYHQELLADYRSMLDLKTYAVTREDTKNYHAYRIFIGLSEALARSQHKRPQSSATNWLNSIYERAGEIAELRIRGYDRQAERLERELWDR